VAAHLQVIRLAVLRVVVAEQIKAVQLQLIQQCLVAVELHLQAVRKLHHVQQMVRSTQVEPHVVVVLKVVAVAALVTTAVAAEIQVAKQTAAVVVDPAI
jgi:hypothetical protein